MKQMKKDIWKQLKKQNDGRQLNLEVSDQKYIDKVTAYAVNQGVGMMEIEIIRKDLIGMGFEAKKEGELLEQRLGDKGEFARELVDAGKAENRKEEKYYFMKGVGFWYLVLAVSALLLVLVMNTLELSREKMNLGGFLYALLMFPWIISFWDLHILGRFALKKWYGVLVAIVAVLTIWGNNILEIIAPGFLARTMEEYIPFFGMKNSDGCYFLLFVLGAILYWYGKKKFTEITEQVAKEQHIEF